MAKSKTASFVVELRLVTYQNEQAILDKRFKIAEKLYNKVLYHARTQLTELYKNRRYQEVLEERRLAIKAKDKKRVSACNKELQTIQKTFGMTEYALHAYIGRMREAYKKHIDSFRAQKIASTVWISVSSLLYGKGKKVRFKKFGQLESLEGKSNATGMRFKGDTYIKKTRDERTTFVGGQLVQRDLYSAFLLKNSQPIRNETDRTKCSTTFATFMAHHDTCIQTLCQSTERQSRNFGLRDFKSH